MYEKEKETIYTKFTSIKKLVQNMPIITVVVVIGPIGVGKTTAANKIANHLTLKSPFEPN